MKMDRATILQSPYVRIGALIGATALLGTFASYRFTRAGEWVPELPNRIGAWSGVDSPVDPGSLAMLGNPHGQGRSYTNPFMEHVALSVISAGPFENYHDPTVCGTGNGFRMTALKVFAMPGTNGAKVRAMIFKRDNTRLIYYYWAQTRSGATETEARMGTYRDLWARIQTGFNAVVLGEQVCLVRILAPVMPSDEKGVQSQRNVEEVARAIYSALQPEAKRNKG